MREGRGWRSACAGGRRTTPRSWGRCARAATRHCVSSTRASSRCSRATRHAPASPPTRGRRTRTTCSAMWCSRCSSIGGRGARATMCATSTRTSSAPFAIGCSPPRVPRPAASSATRARCRARPRPESGWCSPRARRAPCARAAESGTTAGARSRTARHRPRFARLARVIDSELSVSERQMLTWVSHDVPMREIASWLEISYAAAKVRLSRTRSRMRQRALRHVNECLGDERAELLDFFRRSAGRGRGAPLISDAGTVAGLQPRAAEPGGARADV